MKSSLLHICWTTVFYSRQDINASFLTINKELQNINQRFIAHKYSFFHQPSQRDNNPLSLPKLSINNHEKEKNQVKQDYR